MAAMQKAYVDLTCVVHVHSTHSDGSGTVPQIARAAARAGIDVVLLTDHDTLAGKEGWYDDVLVLVGEEVTPSNRDHYLAFDVKEPVSARLSGPEICEAVRKQGGFGFAAHPWSRGNERFRRGGYPWGDFTCLDGIELWSFLNDTGERLRGFRDVARMILAPQSIIGGPPERHLADWDRMCQERRVVAIGGLDAHQFGIRVAGHVPIRAMGYKRTFKQLHTHVLVEEPLEHNLEADKRKIYEALREGRCYIANDLVAPASGFRYVMGPGPSNVTDSGAWPSKPGMDPAALIPMGGEVPFADDLHAHVVVPQRAHVRLIRDGALVHETETEELYHPIERYGVHRVEVLLHGRAWIYSNPVYVRSYS